MYPEQYTSALLPIGVHSRRMFTNECVLAEEAVNCTAVDTEHILTIKIYFSAPLNRRELAHSAGRIRKQCSTIYPSGQGIHEYSAIVWRMVSWHSPITLIFKQTYLTISFTPAYFSVKIHV